MAVLFSDITARRGMERRLAEKARLLDLSNDAIMVRDAADRITLWNSGAEKMYGWRAGEVLGMNLHTLMETEFPKPMEEIVAQLHREGEFTGEVVQSARDGRRVPTLCRWVLDHETGSILTSYTDISERRLLEAALRARAEDLAQADRSKNEFLAMLAHELRNPLAPMRHAAEILRISKGGDQEREEAHAMLLRQIAHMSRMIEDLLDVSRITEGKIELRREPVTLQSVLDNAAAALLPSMEARGQSLKVSFAPGECAVLLADAARLEQAFINLLGNSCKYSPEGSRISLSAQCSSGPGAPQAVVCVRDEGKGIDPALLPHVFDLFVQESRSSDRTHGGLGIGLTLVKRLVTLHGGTVEAHSEGPGRGSEFIVRLPVSLQTPPPSVPDPAPPPGPPERTRDTPRRILIVDDNTDSARSLAMLQSRRGHVTRTAFTGPEAVTAAAEFLPEVALLDIGLPGMDGFEVARRLRAMPELAGVLLVAISGYDSKEDRARAREAGFDEYQVKPADLTLLRQWMRERAGRRGERTL